MREDLQDGGTYLGVLRVVLVLNAIDLLQKVAHAIHLQPRGERVRSRDTAPPAATAPGPLLWPALLAPTSVVSLCINALEIASGPQAPGEAGAGQG